VDIRPYDKHSKFNESHGKKKQLFLQLLNSLLVKSSLYVVLRSDINYSITLDDYNSLKYRILMNIISNATMNKIHSNI